MTCPRPRPAAKQECSKQGNAEHVLAVVRVGGLDESVETSQHETNAQRRAGVFDMQ